jgi:hypothetical protein
VCPYEYFDVPNQNILFGLMRDPSAAGGVASGTPRCGTMQVDVSNTAQGVWAELGITTPLAGNETRYITLANDPYRPQERLALSLGPTVLGATVALTTSRQSSGRVNRAFDQVGPDGLIYCYAAFNQATRSWFVSLSSIQRLSVRRLDHSAGASPCNADPSTWTMVGANTLILER